MGELPESLIAAILAEVREIGGWARRELEAGDTRKGTARDLGQMLAAETALLRLAQARGVCLPAELHGSLPSVLLNHPLVAAEARDSKDEYFTRWLPLSSSVPLAALLGIDDLWAGRLAAVVTLGNCVVTSGACKRAASARLMAEAGQPAQAHRATAEFVFLRAIQANDQRGRAWPGAYLYSGDFHGELRPFCSERVGRVFSLEAILEMSNGVLPNVLLTGGGWGCGHLWLPVPSSSREYALRDTGQYVDEACRLAVESTNTRPGGNRGKCPGPALWVL